MRKFVVLIVSLFVLVIVGFLLRDAVSAQVNKVVAYSPCEEPKSYRIGTVDARFGMTTNEFKAAVEEASMVWDQAYGKKLFTYDPESEFAINFLYDTRQSLNTEINQKNEELRGKDSELRPRIEAYNQKSRDLQERVKKLNEEIENWNSQGGAPDDVFNRLRADQAALREEMVALDREADSLSLTTDELRDEVASLENTVTTFNDALHDRPEGGKYILDQDGERIDIAIFDSREELINVLSHELGHSLGMEHVNDDEAIMYAKTNNAVTLTDQDRAELQKACQKRNLLADRWNYLKTNFFERLGSFISVESNS